MKGTQILMHKDKKVAECRFDSRGFADEITKVYNESLLPPIINIYEEGNKPKINFRRWVLSRGLSNNRKDIAPKREFYGGENFLSAHAFSLFDCYWFANTECKDWESANPYDNWNPATDSLFLMLFNPDELRRINTDSPNLTIPGREQRIWYKIDGDLCLLNMNAQKEMAAYKMGKSNPVVAKREYVVLYEHIFSAMKAETSKTVERISFEEIYNAVADPTKSKACNIKTCCEKFGVPKWLEFFEYMGAFDEATGNTGRELCDVGVLRDADTLEMIGFSKL